MPRRQDTPTVRAIHEVRGHSRSCQCISARAVLLRVERRLIELLEDQPSMGIHRDPLAE